MTAHSPSGERRTPVSSHMTAPPLPVSRCTDHRSHLLGFSGEERQGETEMMLGFWEPAADRFWCFGPDVAQVGKGFRGPGLRCILRIPRGLERAVFDSLGQNHIRILRLKFSVFLGKQNNWYNDQKLSIIKKISAVKF
jgi:hypothetical protein